MDVFYSFYFVWNCLCRIFVGFNRFIISVCFSNCIHYFFRQIYFLLRFYDVCNNYTLFLLCLIVTTRGNFLFTCYLNLTEACQTNASNKNKSGIIGSIIIDGSFFYRGLIELLWILFSVCIRLIFYVIILFLFFFLFLFSPLIFLNLNVFRVFFGLSCINCFQWCLIWWTELLLFWDEH